MRRNGLAIGVDGLQIVRPEVRSGSNPEVRAHNREVRFSLKNRHRQALQPRRRKRLVEYSGLA